MDRKLSRNEFVREIRGLKLRPSAETAEIGQTVSRKEVGISDRGSGDFFVHTTCRRLQGEINLYPLM